MASTPSRRGATRASPNTNAKLPECEPFPCWNSAGRSHHVQHLTGSGRASAHGRRHRASRIQLVDELLARGKNVRALVRLATDATRSAARDVRNALGDLLDLASLLAAMDGADAVITAAAGYTGSNKNATEIDTVGNANLATAASQTGVRRFVLTGILTGDRIPDVPHFWHKRLAEDALERLDVPFVALRLGAFLDQIVTLGGDPIDKARILWMGKARTPLTFVLTADLAGYLAAAVDADLTPGERIDLGWNRPTSITEVAELLGRAADRTIRVRAVPPLVTRAAGALVGPFAPSIKDMTSMFRWFDSGEYIADIVRQTEVFGRPPTPEDATKRLAGQLLVNR
ncbi:NAD(P)H-binding protein [Nocardia sp. NPDC049526]|uniref:NAD(P)H-binding protein n=1 Tax=Nocardia sp. NPDC049526 TaxID=3364316 RepID=UPI0037B55A48